MMKRTKSFASPSSRASACRLNPLRRPSERAFLAVPTQPLHGNSRTKPSQCPPTPDVRHAYVIFTHRNARKRGNAQDLG